MTDHPLPVGIRPFANTDLADFVTLAADPRGTRHVGDGSTRHVGDGSTRDAARAVERAGAAR